MWEAYEKAQRGLSEIALAYDSLVESAVTAVAGHCNWEQEWIERLRGYASKQLREVVARYARDNKSLAKLGEIALPELIGYLIKQKECRSFMRNLCVDKVYDPSNDSLLVELQGRAVEKVLIELAYNSLVEVSVAAVANLCKCSPECTDILRTYASGQLPEIVGQYALAHEYPVPFDEFAVAKIVGHLIVQQWAVEKVCEEITNLQAIANQAPLPPGVLDAWTDVHTVYYATKINAFTTYLLDRNKLQISKFLHAVAPFLRKEGMSDEEIRCILKAGFSLAISRWDPSRDKGGRDANIDGSRTFQAATLHWMQKDFWTAPEVLKGCPQDVFRLIGIIWKYERLLEQTAAGRKPTHEEIAVRINQSGGSRGKQVTAEQVADALAVAFTMHHESLDEMAQKHAVARGDDSVADPYDQGLVAADAATTAPAGCADPAKICEATDEIEKSAKWIPLSEWCAFGIDMLRLHNMNEVEIRKILMKIGISPGNADHLVNSTEPPNPRLVKRAEILFLRSRELVRYLPRSVATAFSEVAIEDKTIKKVAESLRLSEEAIEKRVRDAWRILALFAALLVGNAPASATEIPIPLRKIFKQLSRLLSLPVARRDTTIRDEIEERPEGEYRLIPVTQDLLEALKRHLLEVSVEHLPESEKQVYFSRHLDQESLDEIVARRKIERDLGERLVQRSELLADPPTWLRSCLPESERDVINQIDVNGYGVAHVASDLKLEQKIVRERLSVARRVLVLLAAISARQDTVNVAVRMPRTSHPQLREEMRKAICALSQTTESERRRKIQCAIEERPLAEFQMMNEITHDQLEGVRKRLAELDPRHEKPDQPNMPAEATQ